MTKRRRRCEPRTLTKAQVETIAREMWKERERAIETAFGIKSASWEEASESGRAMMRKQVRDGKRSWLDDAPPPAKVDTDLRPVFDQFMPEHRERLAQCMEQYSHDLVTEWLHTKRRRSGVNGSASFSFIPCAAMRQALSRSSANPDRAAARQAVAVLRADRRERVRAMTKRKRGRPPSKNDQIIVDMAAALMEVSTLGSQRARDLALALLEGHRTTPGKLPRGHRRMLARAILATRELPATSFKSREGNIADKIKRGAIKPRPDVVAGFVRLLRARDEALIRAVIDLLPKKASVARKPHFSGEIESRKRRIE